MDVTEGNEKSTPEQPECFDDIRTYMRRNRKKTSTVWQELTIVKLPNRIEKVQCNHYIFKGTRQSFLPPQAPRSDSTSGIQTWRYDQAKIKEVISHMIMPHEFPFAFIEYELFTLLMKTASPHYVIISRATAKVDCWTSYEVEKKRLNELLTTVDKISITTDMWKSSQTIQYMVLTAHFVDSDWNLQKRILNFVDVPPPHNGVVVYDELYKCL
ncbi:hypothetical protein F3Y22_tig00112518pilonHSYRG00012 [Hibiscus syriacus]|uniref:Uncharacterized protein n=1 Tax=Hibiscus syriacus TaxID=106335 RepID=A0A6A2Y2C8_HIBSY|nr:hypothetical protein F3Y22_tig00112518pilonHSYRG00012 [Hibiscus syriacus]